MDKIKQLPNPLIQEVNDFIDFLLIKRNMNIRILWKQFAGNSHMAESNFFDYLSNLEDYEERLAIGEVKW